MERHEQLFGAAMIAVLVGLAPAHLRAEDSTVGSDCAVDRRVVVMQVEERLGVNPFKFGMVGATHSHTSLATTREDNYFGKVNLMEPGPDRFAGQIVPDPEGVGTATYKFETTASGLEGVPPTQQERAYTSPIWYTTSS
jgi:hypothetical protein